MLSLFMGGLFFNLISLDLMELDGSKVDSVREDSILNQRILDLKDSGYWNLTGSPILIDDTDPANSWSKAAATEPWCNGTGTWDDPYVIENVTMSGSGSGKGIEIKHSNNSYFIIRNCSVDNFQYGIKLYNASNGLLIDNNCSKNTFCGFYLEKIMNCSLKGNIANLNGGEAENYGIGTFLDDSSFNFISENIFSKNVGIAEALGLFLIGNNNTIFNNTLSENRGIGQGIFLGRGWGIRMGSSNNFNISKNMLYNNSYCAIEISEGENGTLSENIMNGSGINLYEPSLNTYIIEENNLVNDKPVLFYMNLSGLVSDNFSNAGQIILKNCNDSLISGLNISFATVGLYVEDVYNITIKDSLISDNADCGITLFGKNNTLINNIMINNAYGMRLYNNDNWIINNTISLSIFSGLYIEDNNTHVINNTISSSRQMGVSLRITSSNNTVYNNVISFNGIHGIEMGGFNHTVKNNTFRNNKVIAIRLHGRNNTVINNNISYNKGGIHIDFYKYWDNANGNLIKSNLISYNNETGIRIKDSHEWNRIYLNIFIENGLNAFDNGTNNSWDNGTIGNYWDDYGARGGMDVNDDLIGDIYYNVNGSGNANDTMPIWDDGPDQIPDVTINSPKNNDGFGNQAPTFDVTIIISDFNASWYTLYNGSIWSINYTFSGSTGSINQTAWDYAGVGVITIFFYANSSKGYVGFDSVNVIKDLMDPTVNILSPQPYELFGNSAPAFIVEINDTNLDEMWYELPGGINRTFLMNETFNGGEWGTLPNGTVTIWFYANDSAGNEASDSVEVRIDVLAPNIIINTPNNLSFWSDRLSINVSVFDPNNDSIWVVIKGAIIPLVNNIDVILSGVFWSGLDDGPIQLFFRANDTLGNLNDTYLIIINKDTLAPEIDINSPSDNQLAIEDPPSFVIEINEANLHSMWYSLNGGENHTFVSNSTINQTAWLTLWTSLSDGDLINITFYANDSLGHLGVNSVLVKVYKPVESDGDGGGDDEFDLIEFLTSPGGLIMIGSVAGGSAAVIAIMFKKKKGYKSSEKAKQEIERLYGI